MMLDLKICLIFWENLYELKQVLILKHQILILQKFTNFVDVKEEDKSEESKQNHGNTGRITATRKQKEKPASGTRPDFETSRRSEYTFPRLSGVSQRAGDHERKKPPFLKTVPLQKRRLPAVLGK